MSNEERRIKALKSIVTECNRNLERFENRSHGYYSVGIYGKDTHHEYHIRLDESSLRVTDDYGVDYLFVKSTSTEKCLIEGLYKDVVKKEKEAAEKKTNEWLEHISTEFDSCPFADDDDDEDGCK